jgi:hypothetical protein
MRNRVLALLAVWGGLLAACDQVEQQLPFDASDTPVTRTVPESDMVLSTGAGASFRIPAGALPSGTTVTLTPVAAAQLSSGTPAAPYAFVLAGDAELAEPLRAELKLARGDAWLASAAVATPQGMHEIGDAAVDLASGVLRARIPHLGTITPVLPAPDAVVVAGSTPDGPDRSDSRSSDGRADASGAAFATRAWCGVCGGSALRCEGMEVRVGENLFSYADLAAVIYPVIDGELTITGDQLSGALVLDAPLRLRMRSGAVAVTIPVRISVSPLVSSRVVDDGGRIVLVGMRVRTESSQGVDEELSTLVVETDGARAWLSLQPNISASFAGASTTASIAVKVPLERVF